MHYLNGFLGLCSGLCLELCAGVEQGGYCWNLAPGCMEECFVTRR